MKKTLTLLVTLLISVGAMAQLNVTSSGKNTRERISDELWFNNADSVYYVVLSTTNQFDDHMVFQLGKGKESAIATLDDFLNMMETFNQGDHVKADNGYGTIYTISKWDNLNLKIDADGFAGDRWLQKPRIKRWRKQIINHGVDEW